jgi:hypothetical protein
LLHKRRGEVILMNPVADIGGKETGVVVHALRGCTKKGRAPPTQEGCETG